MNNHTGATREIIERPPRLVLFCRHDVHLEASIPLLCDAGREGALVKGRKLQKSRPKDIA